MAETFRFGDLKQIWGAGSRLEVSLNDLYPKPEEAGDGQFLPTAIAPVPLDSSEKFRLLKPYVSVRFNDQFKAVIPLAASLILFQILVLRQLVDDSLAVTIGLFAVIVGLMLFMEGLRIGLMPFGTLIGHSLPPRASVFFVWHR